MLPSCEKSTGFGFVLSLTDSNIWAYLRIPHVTTASQDYAAAQSPKGGACPVGENVPAPGAAAAGVYVRKCYVDYLLPGLEKTRVFI